MEPPLPVSLVSEEGADKGEDDVLHTWQGLGGEQFSERIQGKEAPCDNIFHLLLLKCWGLEMEGQGNSRFQ